jgi:phosphate starvation-inducible protein PhoH and related proteins
MSEVATYEFESPRVLGQLYLNDLRNLQGVEETLDVKLTTREGWLRAEGEKENVERVGRMFRQLDEARKGGLNIRRYEFNYALRAVQDPEAPTLDALVVSKIQCSPRRAPIIPKTAIQRSYIQAISQYDMTFGVGPAGTGKTYLAMAMAVAALKKEQVNRIILTRPAVEAGEALGFLPGDLKEKIMPYLRPLYDALHDMMEADEMERLFERGVIEVAPLAYMRGRTLNHAFIVLDEAQNTTAEQMFMFLTRLGADSKAVITGDPTQVDLPGNKRSGLVEALTALRNVKGIHVTHFTDRDVIRHELVQRIVQAYRVHRGTDQAK